jgi:antitoxin component YwqK of YwqJK toxin-antitoxin module
MKAFLKIIFLLSAIVLHGQTQKNSTTSTGKLNGERKEGEWRYFYPSGKLMSVESFTNGALDGDVLYYFPNGALQGKEIWKSGLLQDSAVYYFENERIDKRGTYRNSQYAGKWYHYYESGELEKIIEYVDGLPEGLFVWFEKDGNKLQEGSYHAGVENDEWKFYDKGKILYEGKYANGQRVGDWFKYDRKGNKRKWNYKN